MLVCDSKQQQQQQKKSGEKFHFSIAKMIKMGVKKKHETFEENSINEPAKSNRIVPNEWLHSYRNQAPRSMQTTQAVNGDANYLNKQGNLLEISHGINATNKNYTNYHHLNAYDHENMNSIGENKAKHTQRSTRTYRNQVECSSNAVQSTIVISDEEDDDDPYNAHHQENDYGK